MQHDRLRGEKKKKKEKKEEEEEDGEVRLIEK